MFSGFFRQLRNNLLVGLVILLPIGLTLFIVTWLFRKLTTNSLVLFFTDKLLPLLPEAYQDSRYEKWVVQGLVILFLVGIVLLVGILVRSFFGKKLYGVSELLISRIPVVNKIYIWIRQISEGFVAQRQSMFKEVVLVSYPRKGLYSLAFVTADAPSRFKDKFASGEAHKALFIPTTPNPTSGMMIIAPASDLEPLDISVSDAMKLIISAGAVHPGDSLVDERPTLLDKLETWLAREGRSESEKTGKDASVE